MRHALDEDGISDAVLHAMDQQTSANCKERMEQTFWGRDDIEVLLQCISVAAPGRGATASKIATNSPVILPLISEGIRFDEYLGEEDRLVFPSCHLQGLI